MKVKVLIVCLICVYFKRVHSQEDNFDDELKALTDKDQYAKAIYDEVKNEFYQKYGNREFTVMERITFLKDNLKSVYKLTNKKGIPEDLKMVFRTTFNSLRPDIMKLNHDVVFLKDHFNLTDEEAASYRNVYSKAKTLFTTLEKRFKIEGDC